MEISCHRAYFQVLELLALLKFIIITSGTGLQKEKYKNKIKTKMGVGGIRTWDLLASIHA